jgi:carboxymethylenebutenolidase
MPNIRRQATLTLLAAVLFLPLASHAQDWAKTRLEASPRHREYVALKHGDRVVQALVVYPEVKQKATVVVLIHEIFGLSDWAKEMADELAAAGYIVVAPDLLSGMGPNGTGSEAFPAQDAVMKAVSALPPEQVLADLDAAADYGKKLPASNGKTAVAGFCWGGGKSFAFATHRKDLSAAFVFYGPPPPDVSTVSAPVYGFYAGMDARIDATLPATIDEMKAANKKFEPITYDGAGHGFMRAGEDPTAKPEAPTTAPNKKAREEAFTRLTTILKQIGAKPTPHANYKPTASKVLKAATPETQCHDMKTMSASM